MINNTELEDIIEYKFKNITLLEEALTHSSYANEHQVKSNERLEFLGDAVLELATSKYLFLNMDQDEGILTKTRAKIVCEDALSIYAKKINLVNFIKLGRGEESGGGRTRPTIIADAFEAVLGAIFLDSSFDIVFNVINKLVILNLESVEIIKDYKSVLQEKLQADKRSIRYEIVSEEGPSNNPIFESVVFMDNIILGHGRGSSKQKAEQEAAKEALSKEAK